ncbi:hypothetical protein CAUPRSCDRAFT_10663 [Caulochytrium protostelioides]|uniref:Uncharacterized protein n=1 Tax=Caulochytrium protostelioides TaxID=1555241 RepID=A0A4P9WWA7_9FUNG|nr:hypothetical protein CAUPRSCDRAFT_10663 [Caulochytrium protostelioides]
MLYDAMTPFNLLDAMLSASQEHPHQQQLTKSARSNSRNNKPEHRRLADQPAVDVTETNEQVTLVINLPGLTRDQVTIDFDAARNHLNVGYADSSDASAKTDDDERPDYTGFSRSFAFHDPMDVEKASASMENGVLTLMIPKLMGKKTARITIR